MAFKAKVIDATGTSTGERDLPDELFGGGVNVPLMHQAVTAQLAAARSGTASTKTRSEVRGGGKKPWRQKGTGRARHGSTRSPIWVGGGTVFGPKPRDHKVRLPKKMRRAALRSAFASKASEGRVWILDGFTEPKTKAAAAALKGAGIEGRVLVVLDSESESSRTVDRAFRNLGTAAFSLSGSLGIFFFLLAYNVIFTSDAFDRYAAARGRHGSAEGGADKSLGGTSRPRGHGSAEGATDKSLGGTSRTNGENEAVSA
ncbi:MAG: 50S ribosomal protein L4 [Actinomycetota bacterium]|nr:50S ribosomal protein L4 [Actinomycetota bacterium]